jgi:hypothetical protein
MAVSSVPTSFALATVAVSGTAVAPSTAIPDNCHTVVILNRGAGDGLVGRAAPGAGALTEGTNATRIPANASLSLQLGTARVRGIMNNGDVAGSGLVYDGVGGTTPTFDILYLNEMVPGV